jgi:hypothetical protein
MNRFRSLAVEYKRVRAALCKHHSGFIVITCFTVRYTTEFIKVLSGEKQSLQQMCETLLPNHLSGNLPEASLFTMFDLDMSLDLAEWPS